MCPDEGNMQKFHDGIGSICTCGDHDASCEHSETESGGATYNTHASDKDRWIFVGIYFALVGAVLAGAKFIGAPQAEQDGETDDIEPEATAPKFSIPPSVPWMMTKLGVLDSKTGEQVSVRDFWARKHTLLQLCLDGGGNALDEVSAVRCSILLGSHLFVDFVLCLQTVCTT